MRVQKPQASYFCYMNVKIIYPVALVLLLCNACKKEEDLTPTCDGGTPTYDANIAGIINSTCTSTACHGAGSSRGDWTSYATLKPVLDNGNFTNRILTKQDMPKGTTLSQDELNLMQCWMENGFPEK